MPVTANSICVSVSAVIFGAPRAEIVKGTVSGPFHLNLSAFGIEARCVVDDVLLCDVVRCLCWNAHKFMLLTVFCALLVRLRTLRLCFSLCPYLSVYV